MSCAQPRGFPSSNCSRHGPGTGLRQGPGGSRRGSGQAEPSRAGAVPTTPHTPPRVTYHSVGWGAAPRSRRCPAAPRGPGAGAATGRRRELRREARPRRTLAAGPGPARPGPPSPAQVRRAQPRSRPLRPGPRGRLGSAPGRAAEGPAVPSHSLLCPETRGQAEHPRPRSFTPSLFFFKTNI